MRFFKPTRQKVISSIIVFFLLFFSLAFSDLSLECGDLTNLTLPKIPGVGNVPIPTPTPTPTLLDITRKVAVSAVGLLTSHCLVDPEYAIIATIVAVVLLAIISYLLSCVFVFCIGELKRKNNIYPKKSKK